MIGVGNLNTMSLDIPKLFHGTYWYTGHTRACERVSKAPPVLVDKLVRENQTIAINRQELYRQLCDWGTPRWVQPSSVPNYVREHMYYQHDVGWEMRIRHQIFDHVEVYKLKHSRFGGRFVWVTITSPYTKDTAELTELLKLGYTQTEPVYSHSATSYMRVLMVPEVGNRYVMFSPTEVEN